MDDLKRQWHHSPPHAFEPNTNYMITSGTYHKEKLFNSNDKLRILESVIFETLEEFSWMPIAWALMSNHYHLIARSPKGQCCNIGKVFKKIHGKSAVQINKSDNALGRKVWFEFWDSCLTFENSYYARLKYVMNNPVHHGLVMRAEDYQFCSAGYFKFNADKLIRKRIESYGTENLNIIDDY